MARRRAPLGLRAALGLCGVVTVAAGIVPAALAPLLPEGAAGGGRFPAAAQQLQLLLGAAFVVLLVGRRLDPPVPSGDPPRGDEPPLSSTP